MIFFKDVNAQEKQDYHMRTKLYHGIQLLLSN